jgi:hypothetical protein
LNRVEKRQRAAGAADSLLGGGVHLGCRLLFVPSLALGEAPLDGPLRTGGPDTRDQ